MTDKLQWSKAVYTVQNPNTEPFNITVSGRERWALEMLMRANKSGCTPINNPAPRWSAYVFDLRGQGVKIETCTEPHAGPFPGNHGRYVLKSVVLRPERQGAAA